MASAQAEQLDPARMIAEARRAFFVMFCFLALIWLIQLANWLDDDGLAHRFGIIPKDPSRLPELLSAPLLHLNWNHLEGNSGPLFVFGFLAAYRGVRKFLGLTLLLAITSGLAVWLFQSSGTLTVGASGILFGYLGYVVLRGLFDRHLIDSLIGLVMFASFAYVLLGALPGTPGVSWLGHLGGLIGGLAGAWIFRDRHLGGAAPKAVSADPAVPAQGSRAALLKELDDLGF